MSSISALSGSSNAWALGSQRSQHQAKLFAKVDTDGSGGVDQTELGSMLSDISAKTGTSLGDSKQLFSKMDSNADGSLSSDELAQGMKTLMPPPSTMDFAQFCGADGEDISQQFSQLDTDGDGKLSLTEFEAGKPQAANTNQNTSATQASHRPDSPPPAGGPGGAGVTSATSGSKTYDPLDVNQDGTVSEMERLAGALKELAQLSQSGSSDSSTGSGSNSNSSSEIAKLAQKLYEQISTSLLSGSTSKTSSQLSTTA